MFEGVSCSENSIVEAVRPEDKVLKVVTYPNISDNGTSALIV
jgi:hypothetical protein